MKKNFWLCFLVPFSDLVKINVLSNSKKTGKTIFTEEVPWIVLFIVTAAVLSVFFVYRANVDDSIKYVCVVFFLLFIVMFLGNFLLGSVRALA